MAKSPLDLFKTPGINAKNVRINEPQRDATRSAVAPQHKEKPLIKSEYTHNRPGDDGDVIDRNYNFRESLKKEIDEKFAKNPDAIFSLSDLKKQYGDKSDYSWNTLPWNHIVQDGETYFYGQNADNLNKRIADYKTPYENKLYDRFNEFDYDDNLREVYDSISKRNTQGGGEFDADGQYHETNPHAFPELYYGKEHILRKIRELKSDPRNAKLSDKELLQLAVENAQIDFDEVPELPYTKQEWEQMTNEQWDDTNPKYRGGDPWDNVYESIYDKYESEGLDPTPANKYRDWASYSSDDDYLYGTTRDEEGNEYGFPGYRFRKAQPQLSEDELDARNLQPWREYKRSNPNFTPGDYLGEINYYISQGYKNPEDFYSALDEIMDDPNTSSLEVLKSLSQNGLIDLIYDTDAFETLYSDALDDLRYSYAARYGTYSDEKHNLEQRYGDWLNEDDIESLLNDMGFYDEDTVYSYVEDAIANNGGPYADFDDVFADVQAEFPEIDDSWVEDIMRELGWTPFNQEDFNQWLVDNGSDIKNADRSLRDIIEEYGSGRLPEDLWEGYVHTLENEGGFGRPNYENGLDQFYGRDFAGWLNREPNNPRNYYAKTPEAYLSQIGEPIPEIDNGTSFRNQVQIAKRLVKEGKLSEKDALLYLTSYTNLWKDGLLSAAAQDIIEDEWGK